MKFLQTDDEGRAFLKGFVIGFGLGCAFLLICTALMI